MTSLKKILGLTVSISALAFATPSCKKEEPYHVEFGGHISLRDGSIKEAKYKCEVSKEKYQTALNLYDLSKKETELIAKKITSTLEGNVYHVMFEGDSFVKNSEDVGKWEYKGVGVRMDYLGYYDKSDFHLIDLYLSAWPINKKIDDSKVPNEIKRRLYILKECEDLLEQKYNMEF